MARKRYKPEEIVGKLRQAKVLHGQGMSMADAIRQLGIGEVAQDVALNDTRQRRDAVGVVDRRLRTGHAAAPGRMGRDRAE